VEQPRFGLALEDAAAVAVRIGEGGVEARASARAEGDLAAAAGRALDEVGVGSGSPQIGVASVVPDSPVVGAALGHLAQRFTGRFTQRGATPAGVTAAVAEAWSGAARGVHDVVLFAVGAHAIGGIVRDGVPISGARGRAGSVGWVSLNPVEREDYRKVGCVEAEVAAAGIVRRMIWRIKAGDRSRVQDAVKDDLSAITVDHILSAARANDGVSISVVRDTAKYLGMAAANLVAIADPDMLVLGGIMASAADLLLEPIRTELARRLPKSMIDGLAIETATLGDDAAAIGAARLAGAAAQ
jgi:predicted NBD/HSP70 family sugar kinase